MLQLVEVRKRFGRTVALAGVSLTVAAGEVVGLVGPNGAGKTTLLRIAVGMLDPDTGSARIAGYDLIHDRARAQGQLGYLPETVTCPGELIVERYLWHRAGLKGVARRQRRVAVDRAMMAVDLGEMHDHLIATLSKGFRQRVGLADAIVADPPLLILDEPGSGLDPLAVRTLRDHLRDIAVSRAVLLSSHALGELDELADRVAVLHGGRIVADASPAELRRRHGAASLHDAVVAILDGAAVELAGSSQVPS